MIVTLIFYYKERIIPAVTAYHCDSVPDFEAMKEYITTQIKLNTVNVVDNRCVYACSNSLNKHR